MTWDRRAGVRTEICIRCGQRPPAPNKRRCRECLASMEQDRRERLKAAGDERACATLGCEQPRYRLPSQYSSYCHEHHLLVRQKVRLKYYYGLTLEEYEALVQRAGGCEICGSRTRLVVDHCHKTGTIRGILCDPHNQLLGNAKDDPDILLAAARYLLSSRDALRAAEEVVS